MSSSESESASTPISAGPAGAKRSGGPRTPAGKARSSLNALKTGAYARTDRALHEIMLRRGENPVEVETLHQEMIETWHPENVMEAMLVKSITEKSFDKSHLRAAWMESQLASLRIAEIQEQRRQLLVRRLRPGCYSADPQTAPLWQAKDSPAKFRALFAILDDLQKWFDDRECPEMFPQAMHELYRDQHSKAGERIRALFIDLFGDDKDVAARAAVELPKWIDQERRDVEQERDLYRREREIKAKADAKLSEEDVARKEAAIEKQIREETKLLIQLKTMRSKWESQSEADDLAETNAAGTALPPAIKPGSCGPSVVATPAVTADAAPGREAVSSGKVA